MFDTLRDTLWILALAVILLFAFFVALGAFDPSDMAEVSIGVGVLVVAWILHAVVGARNRDAHQDPAAMRARERRGF